MIKNFNDFLGENIHIPFDDDIRKELTLLFKGSVYDKTNSIDQRIDQLFKIHGLWLFNAKKLYSAEEIAKKLYHYDKHLKIT